MPLISYTDQISIRLTVGKTTFYLKTKQMELTGKCKLEFEKWYLLWVFNEKTFLSLRFSDEQITQNFNSLHLSEQFGVYQDYFDSVGIRLDISEVSEPTMSGVKLHGYRFYANGFKLNQITSKTRQEARTAAIEKANEIRNEQLN